MSRQPSLLAKGNKLDLKYKNKLLSALKFTWDQGNIQLSYKNDKGSGIFYEYSHRLGLFTSKRRLIMKQTHSFKWILVIGIIFLSTALALSQEQKKALVLQEMAWTDVKDYLQTNDMVIIPIGSTEQHGPHMPLGTDYYEATGMAGEVSAETGVLVAPVLLVGYSVYHSGFPGSLSLKPETMENVLFETAEMLIGYGFRRFMFFNYHGGNRIVESKVMHRINHTTEAIAVAIGAGSSIHKDRVPEPAPFDQHAGIGETSIMLYLNPELVKMERAQKPKITLSPKFREISALGQKFPDLMMVGGTLLGVPAETKKGGASHEISSNGIWTFGDPRKATRELGEETVGRMVNNAVSFIEAWKKVEK